MKKNIDFMIYGDDLSKIKRKRIKVYSLVGLVVLGVVTSLFLYYSKDILKRIESDLRVIKRLDAKILESKGELSTLEKEYKAIDKKFQSVDSLNKKIEKENKILFPNLYDKDSVIEKNFTGNVNIDIDSVLLDTEKKLKIFAYITNNFNNNSVGIKQYPSKYPVKDIMIIRKYKRYKDPMTETMKFHRGVDFAGKNGDDVISTAEGRVIKVGDDKYFGNYVKLQHNDSISSFYSHLGKVMVSDGESVDKGQKIAEIGNSGVSTSFHLHFEIRVDGVAKDPMGYIVKDK